MKTGPGGTKLFQRYIGCDFGPPIGCGRLPFGVPCVCGKAEVDGAGITLLGRGKILRESCVLAEQKRQNAGGHGVKCAKVADRTLAGDLAQPVNDIVAGDAGGFVDYE